MKLLVLLLMMLTLGLSAKNVAYIYGDVSADGDVPSGAEAPFDQMLLTDSGNKGLTVFKGLIEGQDYTITGYYARDEDTTLTAAFVNQFDVIIFGLHQQVWSVAEKQVLDNWLRAGGGMMIYSDSASGGRFDIVGINNSVGQMVTNNLISQYGMEVTVDQGGGTRSYIPDAGSGNPIIWDQPEFEGEGVSPVAVDPAGGAQVLIPLSPANRVGGNGNLNIDNRNITITNPTYAAMALQRVGEGSIIVIFDRQPMWNNGPGSDIDRKSNREILRRTVRYLARDYGNSDEWLQFGISADTLPLQLSWRQWKNGTGSLGSSYTVRNTQVQLEYSSTLGSNSWNVNSGLISQIGSSVDNGDETETVTVELSAPDPMTDRLFARLKTTAVGGSSEVILVNAGEDRYIGEMGRVSLEGQMSGGVGPLNASWNKVSGPGSVIFVDAAASVTTATFSQPGMYELELSVADGMSVSEDRIIVRVVDDSNVVRAINCGNTASGVNGLNGFVYEADTGFTGGHTDTFPGNAVSGTEDDLLYNYARSGFSAYSLSVPNGPYTVYLQFAETFFTAANQRVFDLSLEGSLVLNDLDLVASSQGRWVSYDRAITTTVTDGQLTISTTAILNNSLLNAFVIIAE